MYEDKFKNKYRIESTRLQGYDYSQNGYYFITICTHERIYYFGDVVVGDDGVAYVALNDVGRIAQQCWLNIPNHFPHAVLDAFIIMPNHVHGIIQIIGNDAHNNSDTHRVFPRRDVACNVSTVARPSDVHTQHASPSNSENACAVARPSDVHKQHASPTKSENACTVARPSDVHTQNASPTKSKNACTVARPMDVDIKHASHIERKQFMSKISPKSGSLSTIVRSFKSAVTSCVRKDALHASLSPPTRIWQPRFYDKIIRDEPALNGIRHYIKITNPQKWQRDSLGNTRDRLHNTENIWT